MQNSDVVSKINYFTILVHVWTVDCKNAKILIGREWKIVLGIRLNGDSDVLKKSESRNKKKNKY